MNSNTKRVALAIATILVTNNVAFAQSAPAAATSKIDQTLLNASIATTSSDVLQSAADVQKLIENLQKFRDSNGQEGLKSFIETARLVLTMGGLYLTGHHAIVNRNLSASGIMVASAICGLLTTVLDAYDNGQVVKLSDVKKILTANEEGISDKLAQASGQDKAQINDAINKIIDLDTAIDERGQELQQDFDNGQYVTATVTVLTIVINKFAPMLSKQLDEKLATQVAEEVDKELPQILKATRKEKVHAVGVGGMSSTNLMSLAATAAGMRSPEAKTQIDDIIKNLIKARNNLLVQVPTQAKGAIK